MNYRETQLARIVNSFNDNFSSFYSTLSRDDSLFVQKQIKHFPYPVQKILIDGYNKRAEGFESNTYLRNTVKRLNEVIPQSLLEHFDATEDDLRMLADESVSFCKYVMNAFPQHVLEEAVNDPNFIVNAKTRIKAKTFGIRRTSDSVNAHMRSNAECIGYSKCIEFVNGFGIALPEISQSITEKGIIKRLKDRGWWLRKLRKVLTKRREEVMLILGRVNVKYGKYCSNLTLRHRETQKHRQNRLLDDLVMINELNEELLLREVFEANVSNPTNRRHELMTRMNGFETLSKELDHIALFITLTCPSKYHSSYGKSGDRNPKWDGSTPHDAQEYLKVVWSRIRAELARRGIFQYGFRIAEPHADGTPHWHILIFTERKHRDSLVEVFEHYALEEDGNEKGAAENRVKIVDIDPSKGSATGYVAKYVSKNVDGGNLDTDIDGEDANEAARRVDAWASCWGIRQFQQLGSVSVTVWREMRRIKNAKNESDKFQKIHKAADSGKWAEFVKEMGGVFCKRAELAVKPYYDATADIETGELKQSCFDETPTVKIKGVKYQDKTIITREHQWRIERRHQEAA